MGSPGGPAPSQPDAAPGGSETSAHTATAPARRSRAAAEAKVTRGGHDDGSTMMIMTWLLGLVFHHG